MNPLDLKPTDAIWTWICDECLEAADRVIETLRSVPDEYYEKDYRYGNK